MLTGLVKSWVRPFGVDFVKFPPLSPIDRQLKEVVRDNNINLVLDIGACDGRFCRSLRGPIGYEGQIVSFEPCKETFERLRSNMKSDSRWRGFNVGVSDVDSGGTLNTYDRCVFNSVHNLREQDARFYEVDLSKKAVEEIRLRSINSIWNEITKDIEVPRVYLKTDTQGHDHAVIRGAQPRLKSILALQSEIPVIEIYDGMTSMPDMLRFLGSLGYIPIGFHPVSQHHGYGGATPEFDVIFKKIMGGTAEEGSLAPLLSAGEWTYVAKA